MQHLLLRAIHHGECGRIAFNHFLLIHHQQAIQTLVEQQVEFGFTFRQLCFGKLAPQFLIKVIQRITDVKGHFK